MYKISKQFQFCYSHRVWTQQLSPELSNNAACGCLSVHGHNSDVTIQLEGEKLNEQGMLLDFVNLNFFKKVIDDKSDHRTILDINDPYTIDFINSTREYKDYILDKKDIILNPISIDGEVRYFTFDTPSRFSYQQVIAQRAVLVPFVPTSENLCKWFYDIVNHKLGKICKVSSVSFSETPKTLATYLP